ncbi:uncharacterized protein LOC119676338 [Teleopsis dalmanni]|uniref:uncharacterized protein LOC119676338 n=1 Tax=Teleopsis dalmanni TaxID=139649 RepID=UPI0018CE3F25|nr:uncharacterized protein LOC119676338 [Teleopsis dalmanni]
MFEEQNRKKNFILEFLDVYRSLPALWDSNCNDYKNLNIKNAQYDKLLLKYQEKYPKATKRCLSKKISILRINYRREVRRRRELEKSGKKVDDSEGNLYYFSKLDFIRDIKPPCYANSTNKHNRIHRIRQHPQQPTDPKEKMDLMEKKHKIILALKAHLSKSSNDNLNKTSDTLYRLSIDNLNESSNDYLSFSADNKREAITVLNESSSDCLDFIRDDKGNSNETLSDYLDFTIDIKEEPI